MSDHKRVFHHLASVVVDHPFIRSSITVLFFTPKTCEPNVTKLSLTCFHEFDSSMNMATVA